MPPPVALPAPRSAGAKATIRSAGSSRICTASHCFCRCAAHCRQNIARRPQSRSLLDLIILLRVDDVTMAGKYNGAHTRHVNNSSERLGMMPSVKHAHLIDLATRYVLTRTELKCSLLMLASNRWEWFSKGGLVRISFVRRASLTRAPD